MLGLPSRRMHALVAHFIIRASAGQVVTDLFQALRALLEDGDEYQSSQPEVYQCFRLT